MPWYQKTWSRNNLVVFLLVIVLLQGMKWIVFNKQSTTTKMESNKSKNGRYVMKSMEMEDHGNGRVGNNWRSPCGQWWRFYACARDPTNSFTYFHIYGH
jgi:hypothetical protein